jgi:ABC-type sugar transport system permease subunit
LALALVFNATLWYLTDSAGGESSLLESTGIEGDQLVAVAAGAGNTVLTVSRTNELALYDSSLSPTATTMVEDTVGAIAAGPNDTFLVGSSTGVVTTYSATLEPGQVVSVDGRVLAIATNDQGYYVAHGIGAFGVRFFISHFEAGATEPTTTFQVAQPINSMSTWQDGVVYGTANSAVGYFTASTPDAPVWQTQLAFAISRVYASTELNGIVAGDERGAVSLLSADGTEQWSSSVSQYAIRGLNYDTATSAILVGDANGALTQLSTDGGVIYTGSIGGTSDLEGILPIADDAWVAIPRAGEWQRLDPSSASAATTTANLRTVWIAGNAFLAFLALATVVTVVDRWRKVAQWELRQMCKSRTAYIFALPAIGLILLFSYYPAAMAFYYSFTNYSLRSITEWVGLDNYEQILFNDPYFRVGIKNMAIITITSIIKTLTVPLLIAELIFWLRNHWHSYIFRTLFILPTVVPGLVFTLMWRQIYDPDTGLINELLGIMGLEDKQTAWLGNPDTALWAIIGVGFPWVDAFALLILLGGLLNINGDYFDAAKVDGATVWQRFTNIDLPLLVPQFRILLFFAISGTIQGFVSIFVLTRGGPGMTTYIPALQMYMRISDGDFGYASAVGVILFILILIATFIVLRLRRNDGVEAA